MFEPLDERLEPSVRRWQAPRLGADAGGGALPPAFASAEWRDPDDGRVVSGAAEGIDADDADAVKRAAEDEASLQARFDQGRACGIAEGQAAAHAASYGEAASLVAALVRAHERRDTHLEDELFALAGAMVRLILGRELEHDPGVLRDLVRGALERLPASNETPSVVLHPDDATALAPLVTPTEAGRLVADPGLARGDCRVELGDSVVEAGIDAWLARIAPIDAWRGRRPDAPRTDARMDEPDDAPADGRESDASPAATPVSDAA